MQAILPYAYQMQLQQVANAMQEEDAKAKRPPVPLYAAIKATKERPSDGLFATQLIALKYHYQANAHAYDSVRTLQVKNSEWAVVDFLQTVPASHLHLAKLKAQFDLASRVYKLVNRSRELEEETRDDQAQELAMSLYDMLQHTAMLEGSQERASNVVKSALLGTAAAIATSFVNPTLAPVGFFAVSSTGYVLLRIASGRPLFLSRRRLVPLKFEKLGEHVKIAFEPESSGIYNHYAKGLASETLGEVEIDLEGELFQCLFDLSAKHPIAPTDISRLHFSMLQRMSKDLLRSRIVLSILETLENTPPTRSPKQAKVTLLSPELVTALDQVKYRVQELNKKVTVATLEVAMKTFTLFNVSGYKLSCGLYALTLGAIKAYKKQRQVAHSIPKDILEWDESLLLGSNTDITFLREYIHPRLRQELADALNKDQEFIEARKGDFGMVCLNAICPVGELVEMQSFILSNKAFLDSLKADVKEFLYEVSAVEMGQITTRIMQSSCQIEPLCIQEMTKFIRNTPAIKPADIDQIMDQFFGDTKDPVDRLIKEKKLISLTLHAGQKLKAKLEWQKQIGLWLHRRCIAELQKRTQKDKLGQVKTLGALVSMHFQNRGETFTIGHPESVKAECLKLVIGERIEHSWNAIYKNYVEHIRTKVCMLTQDELERLAKSWNIALFVTENTDVNIVTGKPSEERLSVFVTNPSKGHWMTFA